MSNYLIETHRNGFKREIYTSEKVATLPRSKGKDLINYEFKGNSKRTITIDGTEYIVPDGYTLLDSIQSNGTQYIDTGLVGNSSLGIELDLVINNQISSSVQGSFFGESNGVNNYIWMGTYSRYSTGVFDFGSTLGQGYLTVGTRMQISLKNGIYITSTGGRVDYSSVSFTSSLNSFLFAVNLNGVATEKASILLYSCKMYQDNELVRNLVPAKRNSDSVIGMYDFVTNTFFTNAGTGTFTAGNELPTPDNPLGIEGIGDKTKNLFNKNNVNWIYGISANNMSYISIKTHNLVSGGTGYEPNRTFYLSCKSSTTYTVIFGNNYTKRLADIATVPALYASLNNVVSDFTDSTKVYTTSETANYIIIQLYIDDDYNNGARSVNIIPDVMIIEGSVTPSGYIPYGFKFPFICANNCGKVDLGTLNWTYSVYEGRPKFSSSDLINIIEEPAKSAIAGSAYCSKYEIGNYSATYVARKDKSFCVIQSSSSMHGQLWFIDLNYTDAAAFKASLSGVYLYYKRVTDAEWVAPTEYNIYTDEQLFNIYCESIADLGDCTINHDTTYMRTQVFLSCHSYSGDTAPMYIEGYTTVTDTYFDAHPEEDMICRGGSTAGFYLRNKKFEGLSSEEIKTMLTGTKIYYQGLNDASWVAPVWDKLSYLNSETLNISKHEFTGTETVRSYTPLGDTTVILELELSGAVPLTDGLCTHFKNNPYSWQGTIYGRFKLQNTNAVMFGFPVGTSQEDAVAFFQTQYAAGTPVTVYYHSETPITKSISIPTVKTGLGDSHLEVLTTTAPDGILVVGKSGIL